jgi:hypothetical protein
MTNLTCNFRSVGRGCNILTVNKCTGGKCTFAKTKEQVEESINKCNARLATLSMAHQASISDKYYGGEFPWLESSFSFARIRRGKES